MIINKKGQGLSINVIIIAAIALLVLIILAILVARSGTHVSDGTKCFTEGGVCKETCDSNKRVQGVNLCGDDGTKFCCSPVPLRD
ncbi:hypothetical protein H8D36_02440 [archaeon]|nr:hypothetical protein [archaeon]MBL7057214.1 hypothetical protein [Candidatus Woesearchaeota archaeon]